MADVTPNVGDPVQSQCTKCKRVTRHWVVALVEGIPARVQCTACESVHNHRPPPTKVAASPRARSATPRRRPATAAAKAEAAAQEFETALGTRDRTKGAAYRMGDAYRARDLLQHPTFGLGLVRRVVLPNKIVVLFRDGVRTLRCAG